MYLASSLQENMFYPHPGRKSTGITVSSRHPPIGILACGVRIFSKGWGLQPHSVKASTTAPCRCGLRRHGPPQLTAMDGAARRLTCCHSTGRQALAATTCGDLCYVSPRDAAATENMVFFVNCIHMWSFLSINCVGWSLLPQIRVPPSHRLLCLDHHRLQGLAQREGRHIMLQINLDGLVAPWPR
jgi:hypothetical protein